jgi:hypothetical protein
MQIGAWSGGGGYASVVWWDKAERLPPLRRSSGGDIMSREHAWQLDQPLWPSASIFSVRLNLDLGTKLDDLMCRYMEKCSGWCSISLKVRKDRFVPQPHARNVLSRYDGLVAKVVADIRKINAQQFSFLATNLQPIVYCWILHEAKAENDPSDARDQLDHLDPLLVGNTRVFLNQDCNDQQRSCRQWLSLTNCVRASGIPFGIDARKIAVPRLDAGGALLVALALPARGFPTKKRAERLEAKGKAVDFKELLWIEPDSGASINARCELGIPQRAIAISRPFAALRTIGDSPERCPASTAGCRPGC